MESIRPASVFPCDGLHFFNAFGLVHFLFKPTVLAENILGGLTFGIGWGLLGYCPGTQGGALGEGRWDALWGILGMTLGAGLYAELYPSISGRLLGWGYLGFITLPDIFGVNPWLVIAVIVTGGIFMFRWFEKVNL